MMDEAPEARTRMPTDVSLLIVATVSHTVRHFLIPYAAHFRALGWRVDAAANGATGDAALREAFDHVYELPLSRSLLDLGGLVSGERAVSKVLVTGPDLVHVHTPIASFITRLAVRRMSSNRRPSIAYTAHGFHFHRGGQAAMNLAFLAAERLAGRWTDRLIVINDEDYEAARHHRLVAAGRLVRMPGIGVDTDVYSRSQVDPQHIAQARQDLGVGPDTPLFVSVAELSRRKRGADIIEALALMRHQEAALVFAGDGRERERLASLVNQRGLRDRVRFAGALDDVRPLVGGATSLVLASDREGLARSIMEALALEVPVIASTARGNLELVDSDSGFIFPIGDVRKLAESMDWLVDHPIEGLQMGRQGRLRMVERYELRKLILLHEDLYRGMLAAR